MARVQVKNRAGEVVGILTDPASFLAWRGEMRKRCGGVVAAAIDENRILDTPEEWEALPEGIHEAVLVQRTPIPKQMRSKWQGHELWKAM